MQVSYTVEALLSCPCFQELCRSKWFITHFRTCFQAGCMHKFRSSFGKANIIRNREAVALAFSGGSSSLAMLNLAKMVGWRIPSRCYLLPSAFLAFRITIFLLRSFFNALFAVMLSIYHHAYFWCDTTFHCLVPSWDRNSETTLWSNGCLFIW